MQLHLLFSSPSAPYGLAHCLWLHLWEEPSLQSGDKRDRANVLPIFRRKAVCTRVSPHPPLGSFARISAVRGVWLRRRVDAQYTPCLFWFYGFARIFAQTRACILKGIPIFTFSIAPTSAWCRQVFSFFFKKKSCLLVHSHTHAHHTHTKPTPLPAMYLSGLPPAVYQTNVRVVFSSTGLNILFHFPLPHCLTHKCMPHTHTHTRHRPTRSPGGTVLPTVNPKDWCVSLDKMRLCVITRHYTTETPE